MLWGIQRLKTGFYRTLGQSRVELLQEADELKDEVEKWHILAKKNSKHHSIMGVKEKVKDIMQKLSEVRCLLNVSPLVPASANRLKGDKHRKSKGKRS